MQRSINISAEKPLEVISVSNNGDRCYVTIAGNGPMKYTSTEIAAGGDQVTAIDFQISPESAKRLRDWLNSQAL